MASNEDWKKEMMEADERAAEHARELIKDDIQILMDQVAKLRAAAEPRITDEETYAKLVAVVEEATRKNESIAQVVDRVKQLGEGAVSLAKELATKLR